MLSLAPLRAQAPDSCVITSLPYVQDFENCPTLSGSNFIPCWHHSGSNPFSVDIITSININHYPDALLNLYGERAGNYSCVALPKLSSALCMAGQLQMRINISSPRGRDIRIGSMSNPSDTSTFVQMSQLSLNASNFPSEYVVPLVDTLLQDRHIAILINWPSYNYVDIYEVTIEQVPSCGTVKNILRTADGTTGMRVEWNHLSPTNSQYTYSVKVFPPFSGSVLPPDSSLVMSLTTDQQYAIIHNLTPNTPYSIVVSASCSSDTAFSQWCRTTLQTSASEDPCPAPTIARTESDSNSITIEWIPNADSLRWQISYRTHNHYIRGRTVVVDTGCTSNVYTIHGLQPGNTYEITIAPTCNTGNYARTNVSTLCQTISLPWSEDFEDFNPTCYDSWIIFNNDTSTASFQTRQDDVTQSLNLGDYKYTVLPQMDMPVRRTKLYGTAFIQCHGQSTPGPFVVGVMPYDSITPSFIPVDTIRLPRNVWSDFSVFFNNYSGSDGRIAIWAVPSLSYIFVDNLVIDTLAPCPEPYGVEATVTSMTTADVQWNVSVDTITPGPEPISYEVEYGPHGFAHGQGITLQVLSDTITLTGLQHSTHYDLYVRSICSDDTASWSLPTTFTMPCSNIDHLPYVENFDTWEPSRITNYYYYPFYSTPPCWAFCHSNGVPIYINNRGQGAYIEQFTTAEGAFSNRLRTDGCTYIILPRMRRSVIPVQMTKIALTAWRAENSSSGIMEIGVCDSRDSNLLFTPIDTIRPTPLPTRYETLFSSYNGTDEYIAIKVPNTYCVFFLDDVVVDYIPDCISPRRVTATHVDSTHAMISWQPVGTAAHWQIAYGIRGFNPDGVSATVVNAPGYPFPISGLLPGSDHDIYVRSICMTPDSVLGDTSDWASTTITTMQLPARVPYYCDFEDSTEAHNWQTGSNTQYIWTYGTFAGEPDNHGYLTNTTELFSDDWGYNTNSWNMVLYRDIDFDTSYHGSITISYRARFDYLTPNVYNRLYVCLENPTQLLFHSNLSYYSPWGAIRDQRIIDQTDQHNQWITHTVEIDSLHGIHRLAFYLSSRTFRNSVETLVDIDDVQIFHTPCPRPAFLSVDSISDTSARLTWFGETSDTTGGLPARYLVTYRATDTPDILTDTVNTTQAWLTSLNPLTQYTAKVQLICSDTTLSNPSQSITFNTLLCNGGRNDTASFCIDTNETRSSVLPVVTNSLYSYSQQIYHSDYFNGSGSIQAINLFFDYDNLRICEPGYVRIYLGHTIKQQFTGFTDFIDPSSLQLVYIGTMPTQNGWNRISFNSIFDYDGNSNLVLAILSTTDRNKAHTYHCCTSDQIVGIVFSGLDSIDATSSTTLRNHNGTVELLSYRNQAYFDFCSGNPCPQVRPKRPNVRYSRVKLRWHNTPLITTGGSPTDTVPTLYEINYRLLNQPQWDILWDTLYTTDTSIIIDNLYPNYEYLYRVRTVCNESAVPNWAYGTFRTTANDCPFPENLHLTDLTIEQASFAWTPDENNTTYTLHIFNGAFDTSVNTIAAHASVRGLPSGLTYYASVQAQCSPDNRTAEWSDTIRFTTPICPASDSLTYSDLQGNSVVLDWQTDSQNGNPEVTQWEIQYGPTGFTQGNGISVFTDHHPYTLQHLIGETNYDAYVRSICSDDYYSEHWSNKITFTTLYSDITEPDTATFTLHPNPTKDHFTIHRLNSDAPFSVIIRDVHGRELVKKQFATLNLEFSTLDYPSGVYFVTIVTPQGTATRKLIIER